MAKENKSQKSKPLVEQPKNAVAKMEMSLEEARAYRAALHKPAPRVLSEDQKREAFRIFWVGNKAKYGKSKSLEKALWLHLKSIKMDTPEQFSQGLDHFGLKKVK
jgi:hypothetical protein